MTCLNLLLSEQSLQGFPLVTNYRNLLRQDPFYIVPNELISVLLSILLSQMKDNLPFIKILSFYTFCNLSARVLGIAGGSSETTGNT